MALLISNVTKMLLLLTGSHLDIKCTEEIGLGVFSGGEGWQEQ